MEDQQQQQQQDDLEPAVDDSAQLLETQTLRSPPLMNNNSNNSNISNNPLAALLLGNPGLPAANALQPAPQLSVPRLPSLPDLAQLMANMTNASTSPSPAMTLNSAIANPAVVDLAALLPSQQQQQPSSVTVNPVAIQPQVNIVQLLGVAQLNAQLLQQQQQQQLIAQLLAASTTNIPPALPLATLGTTVGQAPVAGIGTSNSPSSLSANANPSIFGNTSAPLQAPPLQVQKQAPAPTFDSQASKDPPLPTNRPPIPLATDYDSLSLNAYQSLLRKQIELFETSASTGIKGCSQGRNARIQIGQVGIRCRHCARLPNKSRPKGAVYYSKSVRGIYQTAQNMAHVHFAERCKTIPNDLRQRIQLLYGSSRRATAGKDYWEECLRAQGVYEDGQMLRFGPLSN